MTLPVALHQILVFVHLFAFAFAFAGIIKADYLFLRFSRNQGIINSFKTAIPLLVLLWVTGIMLLAVKPGLDVALIFSNPKLSAKIAIVVILTANGVFLHFVAWPVFTNKTKVGIVKASFIGMLGVVSGVSWFFASIVGAARVVASVATYQDFLMPYAICLMVGAILSQIFVVPKIIRMYGVKRSLQLDTFEYKEPDMGGQLIS